MCQAVRAGGRRCPIHQHQNIAAIRTAAHTSGLSRYQTERLFAEIRREGRNAAPITETQRLAALETIRTSVAGTDIETTIGEDLTRSAEHDREIDGSSAYALRLIVARAKERGDNLKARFAEVAERTGLSTAEVAAKYKTFMAAVQTTHGSEVPEEYDQNTRRRAVLSNLPYDRASIAALEQLNGLVSAERQRRVTMIDAPENSHIHSYGYDDGRLEVAFRNNPEVKYAYQNVPEQVWENLSLSERPGSVYMRSIRGNEDFMYESLEEAEADAHNLRCASCGQFRAAAHSCPGRVLRNELENERGLGAAEITEFLESVGINGGPVAQEVEPETEPLPPTETVTSVLGAVNETEAAIAEADAEAPVPVEENAFVLASPQLEAVPLFVSVERVTASLPANEGDFINFKGGDLAPLEAYVPTFESQLQPNAFDETSLAVEEVTDLKKAYIANSANADYRLRAIRDRLSDEDYNKILNAPEDINHIIVHRHDDTLEIVRSYSGKEMTAATSHIYGISPTTGMRDYQYGYKLKRLGIKSPETAVRTAEEHRELLQTENAKFEALVASGEAVAIQANVTGTRKYIFDRSRREQPSIVLGKVTDLRRAFTANKVAIMPISIRMMDSADTYDDQGYAATAGYNAVISGEVAVRRNANGVIENVSTGRKLQCSCYDYRRNYDCEHINYAERHIGNVVQQMLPAATANRVAGTPGVHRLLNGALLGRGDVSVVEAVVAEDGTVTEEAYLSYGETLDYRTKTEWSSDARRRFITPENLRNIDATSPSLEDLAALAAYAKIAGNVDTISIPKTPGSIRSALKRSDVSIPVSMQMTGQGRTNGRYGRETVSGTIRFARNTGELQNTEMKSRSLKCTCQDYLDNYDCKHVRFAAEQAFAFIGIGSRNELEANSFNNLNQLHAERIRTEQEIQNTMEADGVDREEAARLIAERHAERIRIEEERQARRAAETLAREVAYAEQRRVQAEAMAAVNAETIANTVLADAARVARWDAREEGYTENPDQFFADAEAALERKKNGEEPITFRTENVTDGICADVPGGRKFGIELEFDIKQGVNKSTALAAIGRELHAAGLTEVAQQQRYHAGQNSGWAKWSFEQDCTVDAELVSPLLSDTPEHWAQVQQVCDIINRNGGHATARTGSHVHISTGSFGLSSAKAASVLRLVNHYEAVITRLSTNPFRGTHRGGQWCTPNVSDALGDVPDDLAGGHNVLGNATYGHGVALNFEAASNPEHKKSHLEFRSYDGTANAAIIQQQVCMSAAMVDAAEREVLAHGSSKKYIKDRIKNGTLRLKEATVLAAAGVTKHNKSTFLEANADAMEFFEKIYRRKEDRAAGASLLAITKYQN